MYYFNCILLIDDDPISNTLNEELLRQLYFADQIKSVTQAEDGFKFIEAYYKEHDAFPELILLDIKMPGMDGFQFLEILNKVPYAEKDAFKISVLTSSSNPSDQELMRKLGVDHYIIKPLNHMKVKDLLQSIN